MFSIISSKEDIFMTSSLLPLIMKGFLEVRLKIGANSVRVDPHLGGKNEKRVACSENVSSHLFVIFLSQKSETQVVYIALYQLKPLHTLRSFYINKRVCKE